MMDEQAVLERITELKEQKQRLLEQREHIQATIYGFDGALQDCEFWLSRIKEEAGKTAKVEGD